MLRGIARRLVPGAGADGVVTEVGPARVAG